MKLRKVMTFLLIGSMVMASYGTHGFAQVSAQVTTVDEKEQEKILEKVLVKVKKVITIPKEYSEFSYSYNNYNVQPSWYLYWYDENGKGSIDITCDNDGNIMNYSSYDYNSHYSMPKYLQSELKGKADAFLKKAAKDQYDSLTYKSASYDGMYYNRYSFVYERSEDKIPVQDNRMVVSVNANTGAVEQFYTTWNYHTKLPDHEAKITKEKATELMKKELKMELEYHTQHLADGKMQTKLLYVPDQTYLAVDALDGSVYNTRVNEVNNYYSMDQKAEATAALASEMPAEDRSVLTEEEIAKIDDLSGLLSKNDAIAALKKYSSLFVDSDATTCNASLYESVLDASNPEEKSYIWRITLSDPAPVDYSGDCYYRAYLRAAVDAKTGKVLSFHADNKTYNYGYDAASTIQLSEEEGLQKAESFLKKYYNDLYKETEYDECYDGYVLSYLDSSMLYGGKMYSFVRKYKGIPFPENQITVGVDLVTGKIYDFSYNWYEKVQFAASDNVIKAEDAEEKYLSNDGYGLVYEINSHYENDIPKEEVRLVYRTQIEPYYMDAFSGEQVYYDGSSLISQEGFAYTDIKGTSYERMILVLADMGIGLPRDKFEPEKAIDNQEFNQLLQLLPVYDIRYSSIEGSGTITREAAAKYAITALHLDYIAKMDIFKSDYKDNSEITQANLGYVVLADQLGIVTSSSEKAIRPQAELTRGEAAQLITKLLENYYVD